MRGIRLLLVEDEESLRFTLAANLELEGYDVVEAEDGEEALARAAEGDIDVVLSDVRMPKLGGVDLLKALKERYPTLPVVLMTAFTSEHRVDEAIRAGVFTVLHKPFEMDAVSRTLATASERPFVLVVDDDGACAETTAAALGAAGIAAKAVFSAAEAITAMETGVVDVCVTDLVMPDMDGVALARALFAAHPRVTVVVFSGHDVPHMMQHAAAAGAFRCMRKPLHPWGLARVIAHARGES